jgi:hypothetical protein
MRRQILCKMVFYSKLNFENKTICVEFYVQRKTSSLAHEYYIGWTLFKVSDILPSH